MGLTPSILLALHFSIILLAIDFLVQFFSFSMIPLFSVIFRELCVEFCPSFTNFSIFLGLMSLEMFIEINMTKTWNSIMLEV